MKKKYFNRITSSFIAIIFALSPIIALANTTPTSLPHTINDLLKLGTLVHYNGIVFDSFKAEQADIEGALAIGGPSNIGTSGWGFDFGAAASAGGLQAIGTYLNPNNYPTLLTNNIPTFYAGNGSSHFTIYNGPFVISSNIAEHFDQHSQLQQAGVGWHLSWNHGANVWLHGNPSLAIAQANLVDDFFANAKKRAINLANTLNQAHTTNDANITANQLSNNNNRLFSSLTEFTPDNLQSARTEQMLVINVIDHGHVNIIEPHLPSQIGNYDLVVFNFPNATTATFHPSAFHIDGNIMGSNDRLNLPIYAKSILWNFSVATHIEVKNHDVIGSVLAPHAYYEAEGGSTNGMLIANNFTTKGSHELHAFRPQLGDCLFDLINEKNDADTECPCTNDKHCKCDNCQECNNCTDAENCLNEDIIKEEHDETDDIDKPEDDDETGIIDKPEDDDETDIIDKPEDDDENEIIDKPEDDYETDIIDKPEDDDEIGIIDKPEDDDENEIVDKPEDDDENEIIDKPEDDDENEIIDKPEDDDENEIIDKPDDDENEIIDKPDDDYENEIGDKPDDDYETDIIDKPEDDYENEIIDKPEDDDENEIIDKPEDDDETGIIDKPEDDDETGIIDKPEDDYENEIIDKPEDDDETGIIDKPDDDYETDIIDKPEDDYENEIIDKPDDYENEVVDKPEDDYENEIIDKPDDDYENEIIDKPDDDDETDIIDKPDDDYETEIIDKPDDDYENEIVDKPDEDYENEIVDKLEDDDETDIIDKPEDDDETDIIDKPEDNDEADIIDKPEGNDDSDYTDKAVDTGYDNLVNKDNLAGSEATSSNEANFGNVVESNLSINAKLPQTSRSTSWALASLIIALAMPVSLSLRFKSKVRQNTLK